MLFRSPCSAARTVVKCCIDCNGLAAQSKINIFEMLYGGSLAWNFAENLLIYNIQYCSNIHKFVKAISDSSVYPLLTIKEKTCHVPECKPVTSATHKQPKSNTSFSPTVVHHHSLALNRDIPTDVLKQIRTSSLCWVHNTKIYTMSTKLHYWSMIE